MTQNYSLLQLIRSFQMRLYRLRLPKLTGMCIRSSGSCLVTLFDTRPLKRSTKSTSIINSKCSLVAVVIFFDNSTDLGQPKSPEICHVIGPLR